MKKIKTFEGFKFKQTKPSQADKLYLELMFEGGDGDTEHPDVHEFEGIKFSEYKQHLDEIQKVIDQYQILGRLLDCNGPEYYYKQGRHKGYETILQKYGEDMAALFDNAPNDPQTDYDMKCYLGSMKLVGYDAQGNRHEAYV